MKTLLYLALLAVSMHAFPQTLTDFSREAEKAGLTFTMPDGFHAAPVIVNRDLDYSFAIVNEAQSLEIRYSVFPMQPLLEQYKKSLRDPEVTMIDPNKLYLGINMANNLNMTGGEEIGIVNFPPKAVKEEFNADWGGSSFFEFRCAFGKGWKYGQAVYLHKQDTADVIITFMSNDRSTHAALMEPVFHALRFAKTE